MSKQGCKTLRKMFVFMALFPPLRTPNLPAWITQPPLPSPRASPCLASSRNPLLSPPPPVSFLLPPAVVFQSARRGAAAATAAAAAAAAVLTFLAFLFSSLFAEQPHHASSRASLPLPLPRFFLCRLLYPTTFSPDPYPKQPLPTIGQPPTRRREFAPFPPPFPPPPPLLRRHFNVTLIKSNNQYLPRKKF